MSAEQTGPAPERASPAPAARPSSSADHREPPPAAQSPGGRPSLLRGVLNHVSRVGRDFVTGAVGRLLEGPPEPPSPAAPGEEAKRPASNNRQLSLLHGITEQLRGAADNYVAAKLDEIEARVDQKLDHIEARIDRKLLDLNQQLAELRDRELRHRLRLLKITLVFTALVAVLSLGYKWITHLWLS